MNEAAISTPEQEALKRLKNETRNNHEFFGNQGKEERERISVSELLSFFNLEYSENEIISQLQSSKTDVSFRDASFQIKELMNENFPRNEIYKNARKSAEDAQSDHDIQWNLKAYDVPSCAKLYDLIIKLVEVLEDKYSIEEKSKLDLLIYVTRGYASHVQEEEIQQANFESLGWRSVLCVNSKQAVIFYSSESSPDFIRNHPMKILWANQIPTLLCGDQA